MKDSILKEIASGGAVGAGSIAVNMSRFGGDMQKRDLGINMNQSRNDEHAWHSQLKQEKEDKEKNAEEESKYAEMRRKIKRAKKKKGGFKNFLSRALMREERLFYNEKFRRNGDKVKTSNGMEGTVSHATKHNFVVNWSDGTTTKHYQGTLKEAFDMTDVISRMKGIDVLQEPGEKVVSYGVEDDNGNIMKVTVRADQAKEFEHRIARLMAERKDNMIGGVSTKPMSLAELLFSLRNEFEIVDVQFPIIPTDIVYNANAATKVDPNQDVTNPENADDITNSPDQFGDEDENQEGDEGDIDLNAEGQGEESGDISNAGNERSPDEDENGELSDDESVEDFTEPQENDEESLIKSVLGMMKADADARKAEADAEAEKARAKQAEYTAMATDKEMQNQEKIARVKAEMGEQKEKEKKAKELAQIAQYRVSQTRGSNPNSFNESFLGKILKEFDENDSLQNLNRERQNIQLKYRILPTDDNAARTFKSSQLQQAMRELNAKIAQAKNLQTFNATEQNKQKQTSQQQQRNQNTQQPQAPNNPAPNNAAPATQVTKQ